MPDLNYGAIEVNLELLDAEARAAAGDQITGISLTKEAEVLVNVSEGVDADALKPVIDPVIAAHDPAKLSAQQVRAARATKALDELRASDFKAWVTAVKAAGTLALLKPLLLALGRVVWLLVVAQGLTDAEVEE